MKPNEQAKRLLAVTRSKAKMYEYDIPESFHIKIEEDPSMLFDLTIGILGDTSADEAVTIGIEEQSNKLLFSAHYFDAFLNSKLNVKLSDYLKLLASSAYYLSGFPGSSQVLISHIGDFKLGTSGLEWLALAVLKNSFLENYSKYYSNIYSKNLLAIQENLMSFFQNGNLESSEKCIEYLEELRKQVYANGSDRELLLADVIRLVCLKKLEQSTWKALPKYSDIPLALWRPFLKKPKTIQELWPAQLLLAKQGVLRGQSAVVQMPTSAGKTKAAELILRSAFLSGRTKMAVIVAPYRALCNEIYDDLATQFMGDDILLDLASDVLQEDIESFNYQKPKVLIMTPEKLDYLLRHIPDLASGVGLIIYDEGHLFDDSSRGVSYELLLASLRRKFDTDVQVVLVSAVINNAEEICSWLTGSVSNCVVGRHLHPTYRTVAFSSWIDKLGQLRFVDPESPEQDSFFVPRILETQQLQLRPRERKTRLFPTKDAPAQVALYLGCKLVHNGAVAIFAGTKVSASGMAREIVDAFSRGLSLALPNDFSDKVELKKLIRLYKRNLGSESEQTQAAKLGIFVHHGSTPHGFRLAIEYALQKDMIKFVICTSTLAQGVNLPLRYLIVKTDRQGRERIRYRDFHNLMGRAGRAGMHTEGTVIFANPDIFDTRLQHWKRRRWDEAISLLDPDHSEPCKSYILSLFDPIKDLRGAIISHIDPVELARLYYEKRSAFDKFPDRLFKKYLREVHFKLNKEHLAEQLYQRRNIFRSITSYLLRLTCESQEAATAEDTSAKELLENSLAFQQANDEQKGILGKLFDFLEKRLQETEPSYEKRKAYSKTILDLDDCQKLMEFLNEVSPELRPDAPLQELFERFWQAVYDFNSNRALRSVSNPKVLKAAGIEWLNGSAYKNIYPIVADLRFGRRQATMNLLIDICENGFGFDGSLIVGACIELLELTGLRESIKKRLQLLQRALKYGLSSELAIVLYELGFADRGLALMLANRFSTIEASKSTVKSAILKNQKAFRRIVSEYPSYFVFKLEEIVSSLRKQ